MNKYRWFNVVSIVCFFVLLTLLVRPTPPSVAQSAATPIGLEPTVTPVDVEYTLTPVPIDTVTPEPSATLEPTETPTPTPEPMPQLHWDITGTDWKVPAGGQINIPLRLNISDAGVDELAVSAAASGDGFTANVSPSNLGQLSAGDGVDLVLNVNASAGLPVGVTARVVVMADDHQGHSAETEVNLTVAWEQPITVEFDPQQQPVDPGGLVIAKVQITNRDAVPHEIQSRAYMNQDAPFDYQMPEVSDFVTLQPGEVLKYKFGLQSHLGAEAGSEGKVTFETLLLGATNKAGKNVVVGAQAQAVVSEMYNVALSVSPGEQQPAWGELATYTVDVTNTGSLPSAVLLDVTNGPTHYTATLQLPADEVKLNPGQTAHLKLEVEPLFAGLPSFLADIAPRFHDLTSDDKQQFGEFLRDRDQVTITANLQQIVASTTATTLRPERPTIDRPTSVAIQQVKTPVGHGPHATNSLTCGACHTPHGSPMTDQPQQESSLLLASTVRGLCDTCHDGTGSVYNVEAGLVGSGQPSNGGPIKLGPESITTGYHYTTKSYHAAPGTVNFVPINSKQQGIVVSGPGAVSAHPIGQVGTPAGGNVTGELECTSCHDPHGKTDGPRLLSINFAGLKISLPFQATYSKSPEESVNLASGSLEVCQSCHAGIDNHGASVPRKLTDNSDFGKLWSTYQQRGAGWLPLESEGKPVNQHLVCLTCHTAHGSRASLPGSFEKLMREPFAPIQEKYGTWCAACHDL